MNEATNRVFESYVDQQYRISNLTIAPVKESQNTQLPTGFIISAWSPSGKTTTYEKNLDLSWELQKEIMNLKLKYRKVIQVEKTRAWIEDAFLIEGINKRKALSLAKKFKQAAFVELANNKATIHATNSTQKKSVHVGLIPTQYGCPAKKGGEDLEEFCKQHGYWATGQALAALVDWRDNITIVNSRLGCNLCNNVTTHPNLLVKSVKPEDVPHIRVTNRHSIAQWVRL